MTGNDELLSIRAAELYYEEDKTQDEIGTILRITRWKVGRLIAQARANGFIRIEIVHPRARRLGLERQLRDSTGLKDAIIVGTGTRFGRMGSQMGAFLDQAGGLWMQGALNGKVGAAFTSTAAQHGGQETTLFSILTNLMHFGMVIVGLPYSFSGQQRMDEITGGSPYGATTLAGAKNDRLPSENELAGARFQGRLVAETAKKLHG